MPFTAGRPSIIKDMSMGQTSATRLMMACAKEGCWSGFNS